MARPRKTGLDYFQHDTTAVNDEKIEAMRALYGNNGYAFYFILLERIYRNDGMLSLQNPAIAAAVQRSVVDDPKLFEQMLTTAFQIELFDYEKYQEEKILTSEAIQRRYNFVDGERSRKRDTSKEKKAAKTSISGITPEKPRNNPGETPEVPPYRIEYNRIEQYSTQQVPPKSPTGDADSAQGENVTVKIARGSGKQKPVYHSTTLAAEQFASFWEKYPKKVGKTVAEKAWKKLAPDEELFGRIMDALCIAVRCDQWRKDNGQFIPNPATWLNQRRWEDELAIQMPELPNEKRTYDMEAYEEMDFLEPFPEFGG